MRASIAVLVALAAWAGVAPRAAAYLDAARFDAPALEGGSGGRRFTGAPADGFSCAVCHRGGVAPNAVIVGVPSLGFTPGETYDLAVELAPAGVAGNHAAVLEVAGADGRGVGRLALVAESALDDAERCAAGGSPSTSLVRTEGRLLARLSPCGARRLRVRWTAPNTPVAGVRAFVSAVRGDFDGTPSGDGAIAAALALRARDAPSLEAARTTQACAVSGARAAGAFAWAPVLAGLAFAWRRRSARG